VRSHKTGELVTAPHLFLGPARYVEHTGDRSIAITRRLKVPMPADFFAGATVVAS
jgi:hypothetical protein